MNVPPRTCGECAACCTADPVQPLNKPAGVRCRFQAGGDTPARGCCSDYANRPRCCAVYRCAWLAGHGNAKQRPDRSGVIVELAYDALRNVRLATLLPAPGFTEECPAFRAAVRLWRTRGAIVTTPTTIFATYAELAWLRSCSFQFADGVTVGIDKETSDG